MTIVKKSYFWTPCSKFSSRCDFLMKSKVVLIIFLPLSQYHSFINSFAFGYGRKALRYHIIWSKVGWLNIQMLPSLQLMVTLLVQIFQQTDITIIVQLYYVWPRVIFALCLLLWYGLNYGSLYSSVAQLYLHRCIQREKDSKE